MNGFLSEIFIKYGLCGHSDKIELIKAIRTKNNSSHSFLFYGPKNIGKSTFAKFMALSINCLSPDENGLACYKCERCQKILNSRFEYLTFLNYNFGEIPIDDIRNRIIAPCALKVPSGVKSVYIINDARYFNSESANCFLKTLEEPVENIIFILITSFIDALLPTIRSRCQIARFEEPKPAEIFSYAQPVAFESGIKNIETVCGAAGSIGAVIAALTGRDAVHDSASLDSFTASLELPPAAKDAAGLAAVVYSIESADAAFDFCSENVLQLDELFDRIERERLSKQYLRLMLIYRMLLLAGGATRRDYQSACYELSYKIDAFYQHVETRAADYISGFKNTIATHLIKEMLDKTKKETARFKREEYLKIVSLTLGALEKIYVYAAAKSGKFELSTASTPLEKAVVRAAEFYEPAGLEKMINVIMAGHYRDVAANINVELYLEHYLMSIVENKKRILYKM